MALRLLPVIVASVWIASTCRADAPLPPAEAPRHMTVPAGFTVSLFAGEPDVVQPIAFTIDERWMDSSDPAGLGAAVGRLMADGALTVTERTRQFLAKMSTAIR